MRAHQLMLAEVENVLRPFGLSFARFELLRLLAFSKEGRMPMSSATARLQVHPASVTNSVARLERDGLLEREPHPVSGRAVMLRLTPAGSELTESATAALNEGVFSHFSSTRCHRSCTRSRRCGSKLGTSHHRRPRPITSSEPGSVSS
ncbi:MAG: MarR family winged helix-turn-helix transcriptional regulator [Leucobacter sp.]